MWTDDFQVEAIKRVPLFVRGIRLLGFFKRDGRFTEAEGKKMRNGEKGREEVFSKP